MQLSRRGATWMLVLVTLMWGGGFAASEYALRAGLGPAWILLIRFSIGSLFLLLCFFRGIRSASGRTALHGIWGGVILYAAFLAQLIGQGRTTVPNAALLTTTNVIMVPFIIWAFRHRRPHPRIFLLCLASMSGMVLLTLDGELRIAPGIGDLLILLCAFLFALHIAYLELVCFHDDPVPVAFWQLLTCAVMSGVSLLLFPSPVSAVQLKNSLLPCLYLGLFSTGACYLMQTKAQTVLPAARAGIVMSLEGFFGTVFSLLLGLAVFRPAMAVGGLILTASVVLSSASDA